MPASAALFLALAVASAQASEPLDSWTNVRIEQEIDGSCAEIRAGRSVDRPAMIMDDVCHGWRSETCGDRIWFQAKGVVQDQAQVLFTRTDGVLDIARLIDDEVARRWSDREVLRLEFTSLACGADGLVARYVGSHVKTEGGPATGMAGEVRIGGPYDHALSLKPVR
ncbi:hypothetical protein [Caulobacter radicis]|uniref:Uncharacterized protein n=1 Tax=Caulobacter radicis TaxID=2172650 RepID=A0A2T9J174_9CAUL|nr:hypothetical protein [Caulobacter radicis]PVM73840.1 hypothetical protein DDF65_19665 [Caulobacter radicis]